MKKRVFYLVSFLLAAVISFTISCDEDDDDNKDENQEVAMQSSTQQAMAADNMFTDAFVSTSSNDVGMSGMKSTEDYPDNCATIDINPLLPLSQYPKTLTIDFGTTQDCQSPDGFYRAGKIITTFSGPRTDANVTITTTFENYQVDTVEISGTITTTTSINGDGNLQYSYNVIDGEVTTPSGTISHAATKTIIWSAGMNTLLDPTDDEFTFSGSSSGTTIDGKTYTTNTSTSLAFKSSCLETVSGVIDIVFTGLPAAELDFGDGTCDNQATLTWLNSSIIIDLP